MVMSGRKARLVGNPLSGSEATDADGNTAGLNGRSCPKLARSVDTVISRQLASAGSIAAGRISARRSLPARGSAPWSSAAS